MMDLPPDLIPSPPASVASAARGELVRLGVPAAELDRLTADALRPDARPPAEAPPLTPEREGVKRAHRAVLSDCADAIARAIVRRMNLRRVPRDQQGDIAHDTIVSTLENDHLDDFNTAKVVEAPADAAARPSHTPDATAARERFRRGIASYLGGVAWRLWSNDIARDRRHAEIRAALPAPAPSRATDADGAFAEIIDWLHANVGRLDREVFLRRVVEEQPQAEVAEELQLTPKAVETRLRRVRERLKAWLGERPRNALLPAPVVSDADLDALLRRIAERARREAEPSDDDVSRVRERIRRGLLDDRPLPPSPRARVRSLARSAAFGATTAAMGFAAALALRAPAAPPAPPPPIARTETSTHPVVAPPIALEPERAASSAQPPARDTAAAQAAPSTPRAPPRPRASDDALTESPLARETSILGRAQTALTSSPPRPDVALAAVEAHARRHPQGQLTELREFLRVKALRALDRRDDARAAEAAMRARYPQSPYLTALDRAPQR